MTDLITLGRFGVIYADPPWPYRDLGHTRRITRQYPVMSLADICAMPVTQIAERNSMLLLWIPPALLPDGLTVMQAWGFRYLQNLIWIKHRFVGGHYWRGLSIIIRKSPLDIS